MRLPGEDQLRRKIKRRRILQKFADGIKKLIREAGGEVTLTKVALHLPKLGDFLKARLWRQGSLKRG